MAKEENGVTSDRITKIKGRPILWTDADGVTRLCEGADVHPGIRLFWTCCGKHDIPAGEAWIGGDAIPNCDDCFEKEMGPPDG